MNWPSRKVRDTFIQYFLHHPKYPHGFIPSSSIVPKNDPSLAFVNAGMNQFKDIILGYGRPPPTPRVTNSQKCLRINDLHLVGTDSYHHTFFEMLGNWSFSNYFKKESCQMAWDLLTRVYGLDPQRLYVTYYSGDSTVPTDRETKEIWEDIGVSPSRILPFGKENFWSIGPVGPCGPSTEIHYDHRGIYNDPSRVNRDDELGTVIELWNLVFMQYNRTEKGTLERLPLSHVVDTGAGLERLTAVMNGKISNYDTDLFLPIFDTIHNLTAVPKYSGSFQSDLDTGYRTFSDHMRASVVALSDGILPQTNHKIRRLIQRSLSLTETNFLPSISSETEILDFLQEIIETISNSLSHVYPEIESMKEETLEILEVEIHRYISARKSKSTYHELLPKLLTIDFPGLAKIKSEDIRMVEEKGIIDGATAYRWCDTLGLTEEALQELSRTLSIPLDSEGLKQEMDRVKKIFRDEVAKEIISNEEKQFMKRIEGLLSLYNPKASGGIKLETSSEVDLCSPIIPPSPIWIEWIFDQDADPIEEMSSNPDDTYWVVLNQSPFTPGTSKSVADVGTLELDNNCKVNVIDVRELPSGWILHQITNVPEIGFRRKAQVARLTIDNQRRTGRNLSYNVYSHVQHWLEEHFPVVRFANEFISWDEFSLQITILSPADLSTSHIHALEEHLNGSGVLISRLWKQNGVYDLTFATGTRAQDAIEFGHEVNGYANVLRELISTPELNYAKNRETIRGHVETLYDFITRDDKSLPYEIYVKAEKVVGDVERFMEKNDIIYETQRISRILTQKLNNVKPNEVFIVESFHSDVEFPSLIKLSRPVAKLPSLIIIQSSDGWIQGRCSVPLEYQSEEYRADKWMRVFTNEIGRGIVNPPKGQDSKLVVNLKRVRVPELQSKLNRALNKAVEYGVNNSREKVEQKLISSSSNSNSDEFSL